MAWVSRDRVLMVPGNHDVDRGLAAAAVDPRELKHTDPARWLAKFDRYLALTEFFYGEEEFEPDRHYRAFELGDDLAVVAFNSCVTEGHPSALCTTCYDPITKEGSEHYHGWLDPNDIVAARAELAKGSEGKRKIRGVSP